MKAWEKEFFGRPFRIETERLAKQSHGSVLLTFNESNLLVTVNASETSKPDIDFLPLTVEFQERYYAIGRIPGGFVKREGRPSEDAILSARLIDRPIRPLFPKDFHNEVQVILTVLSMIPNDSIETWGITAASLALNLSPIPFDGVVAGVRVALVDEKFIAFPTTEELKNSKLDIVVAGTKDAVAMVEGESLEVSEDVMVDAIMFAHNAIKEIVAFEEQIIAEAKQEKFEIEIPQVPEEFLNDFLSLVNIDEMKKKLLTQGKKARDVALDEFKKATIEKFEETYLKKWSEDFYKSRKRFINEAYEDLLRTTMRKMILEENTRVDGRNVDQIRPITCETRVIPRLHGSGLFTRGETQSLGIVTLGVPMDVQQVDNIFNDEEKRFMLHYNFPPYATGEVKGLRGISRREIGHGHLAERAHKNLIPHDSEFPYTIRVVSEIFESNGSSSMASVCSASLAMMDAGVPLKKHVAGIAMGLIYEDGKYAVLSDILGMEDHLGDMDFKVTGTREGITAFQMDVKVAGINEEILRDALRKARIGREHILNLMYEAIPTPKPEISPLVPVILSVDVPLEKFGEVIGPAGKVIKELNRTYGVEIELDETTCSAKVSGMDKTMVEKAIKHINGIVKELKAGEIFEGKVTRVEAYGLFVEILPNKIGLIHISNLGSPVTNFKVGDIINVEYTGTKEGKIELKKEGFVKPERSERPDRGDRSHRPRTNDHREHREHREAPKSEAPETKEITEN